MREACFILDTQMTHVACLLRAAEGAFCSIPKKWAIIVAVFIVILHNVWNLIF